jgi:hypothetical protein
MEASDIRPFQMVNIPDAELTEGFKQCTKRSPPIAAGS